MGTGTLTTERFIIQLIFLCCTTCVFSQQIIEPDTIIRRLATQARLYPQENIYLHTDKSDYVTGDTVWFRAYTVNAISRKQEDMSRYVYAELIDSEVGKIISRVKVKKDSNNKIYGYLPISPVLPKGIYYLRAYTRYGFNWGEKSCFSKALRIYTNHKGQEKKNHRLKNSSYQVVFMPEGGQAIDRQPCRLAFRAQSSNGKGENIQGLVIDEQKDTLLYFKSIHNGMGNFQITLDKKKKYYAVCSNDSGQTKHFILPQAVEGSTLSVTSDSIHCHVTIVHDESFVTDSLQLAILQRGHPRFVSWWNPHINRMSFPIQGFNEGIIHFLLLSRNGGILSERLFFINRPEECKVSLSCNRNKHVPRQLVKVILELETNERASADGDCSLTVTDANDVPADETVNIRSALLLTADLSGIIEMPGWYFKGTEPELEKEGLDLLMLTHGWRRYDLQNVLKGNYTLPSLLPEVSMSFSGRVENLIGKPLPNSTVRIHAQGTALLKDIQTDEKGRFLFDGFEFPDSIKYFITAQSAKGKKNVTLLIDSTKSLQPVSESAASFYYSRVDEKPTAMDEKSHIEKTMRQIGYGENMRHYLLGEVKVTSSHIKKYKTEFEQDAQITIKEERLRQSGASNLGTLIRSISGLAFVPDTDGKLKNMTLVLDGSLIEEGETVNWLLHTFEVSNIQQIDVIKHSKTAGYFDGRKGTIVAITTKRGGTEHNLHYVATNMATLAPLGYQRPIERYSPTYDRPSLQTSQPDLRTTIYWKPDIIIKEGKTTVSFYTADSPSKYRVAVEGISSEGKVFKKTIYIF